MLNSYYFTGMGNDIEGYTILSGDISVSGTLSAMYVLPYWTYDGYYQGSNTQILSPRQYVSKKGQLLTNVYLKNGTINGLLLPTETIDDKTFIDVNSMFDIYKDYAHVFYTNDMFVLNTTLSVDGTNLVRTSNHLYSTNVKDPYDFFDSPDADYIRQYYANYNYRLLVPSSLIDLTLTEAYSQNVYEHLTQTNMTMMEALSSTTGWTSWGASKPARFPISNYGNDLSVSAKVFGLRGVRETLEPFFGLSATTYEWGDDDHPVVFYEKDVYYCYNYSVIYNSGYLIFNESPYAKYCTYEDLLNGFSFKSPRYVLSSSLGAHAILYKNNEYYIPISYYDRSFIPEANYSTVFNVGLFGKFDVISGEYIQKQNSFYWGSYELGDIEFGEWLSGLQHVSGMMTNVNCVNFNIVQNTYDQDNNINTELIGVKNFGTSYNFDVANGVYYKRNTVLNKIKRGKTDLIYIAIDPQSYTIAI